MENKYDRTLILSGGHIERAFLESFLLEEKFDCIICVVGGQAAADEINLPVNWLVGDFDSVSEALLRKYEDMVEEGKIDTAIRRFKPEKDATDTELAIELALELKSEEIVILGATGTRMDHTLGNLYLLLKPLTGKVRASIINENNKIYLINQNHKIIRQKQYGSFVSLLPLSEQVTDITLTGFKYPLNRYTLTKYESIGISNEVAREEAWIELGQGILIVVESKD